MSGFGLGATRFRKLAREPSPEVAYIRHWSGVVDVTDALEAAVVDHQGPSGIEQFVRVCVARYPCVFYGGKHIPIHALLACSKSARTDLSPAQRRAVATLVEVIRSAGKERK